ncbi:MAG: hypothetical protein HY801_05650 [Candidatus Lindowbacteria bacterium]|nr:hypothetical protein [Candidatus Lindowbacteria bacterium]
MVSSFGYGNTDALGIPSRNILYIKYDNNKVIKIKYSINDMIVKIINKTPLIEEASINLQDYSAVEPQNRVVVLYHFLIFKQGTCSPKGELAVSISQFNVDSVTFCDGAEQEAVPIKISHVYKTTYTNNMAASLPVKIALTPFTLLVDPIITPACYIYMYTHFMPH